MSTYTIGVLRIRLELKEFTRHKGQMLMSFAFPVLMLGLLSMIGNGDVDGTDVPTSQVFAAGMLAVGIVTAGFQGLAMSVAEERKDGTLKRLRGTPMPPAAYFIGKVGQVLAVSVVQAVVLIAVGVALMDLPLPHGVTPWATFAWLYAMGVTLATLLGIAASHTLKKGANGAAIALPFTALQFVSGVFIPFNELPSGAQQFSALFPLKWLCQGMRSVFLPDSFAAVEPAGAWELTRVALVLGVWIVIALVLCLKTFSWSGNEDK